MKAESSRKVKFEKGTGRHDEVRTITVAEHLSWILERLGKDLEHYKDATVTIYYDAHGSTSYRIVGDDTI